MNMKVASDIGFPPSETSSTGQFSDGQRLQRLRALSAENPAEAQEQAWRWLRELRHPSQHHRLAGVFERGVPPDAPHGDCEGMVMNLHGSLWLDALDRLVRLGQVLGGIGWTGKSFDTVRGTGHNRLSLSTRIPAALTIPTYRFEQRGGELIGFRFNHARETSPIAPGNVVLAIKYDAPEHANPLVLPRTRDELVEIIPHIYLGRALLRERATFRVVGYFGLRGPRQGRNAHGN